MSDEPQDDNKPVSERTAQWDELAKFFANENAIEVAESKLSANTWLVARLTAAVEAVTWTDEDLTFAVFDYERHIQERPIPHDRPADDKA